ncbi:hypothetical protein LOZ12_000883 [Ophidiomyces ophidiicola]|uniref:Uncharacterized protein n=1 Tax=Ophidiomyces ophidiicola TaxID=1387563 RepID=A0ACB8V6Q9_9EURO|nr:hypothetical protein LOZ61_001928 [Ophidiomyces ophidiicola]KAI1930110.1 hypothetical protein LOZ60_001169 [Ophidiomyces ophidiicola]KAI1955002.1 hypothetical protein LOZ62_000509 [Ophidiomyces ophidiicola]KAI1965091.1 hypothetical protein LOZ59_001417 [Ophidiomyces ophidiicola]KAI2011563.1 hypothetical protein LOZ50_000583 [Ophidiomyces ophidiicola]
MQFIKVATLLAVTVVGVSARYERPAPRIQQVTCSSGDAYCCAPSESKGTTCTKLSGSSVSCNSLIVCCNNMNGVQSCSATMSQPVQYINV